mgnify:CR=1 FL=1
MKKKDWHHSTLKKKINKKKNKKYLDKLLMKLVFLRILRVFMSRLYLTSILKFLGQWRLVMTTHYLQICKEKEAALIIIITKETEMDLISMMLDEEQQIRKMIWVK